MKTFNYLTLIVILPVCMVYAGEKNPADADARMEQAITKERQRAEDARQQHADTERFEQRHGWAKEKHPGLYAAMLTANQKAADAWAAVARQGESATTPAALIQAKQAAGAAASEAHLAEMAIKYAAAASERSRIAEKAGCTEVSALAAQLEANEKALLAANRARNEAAAIAEKLHNENRVLTKALHDAYNQARYAAKPEEHHPKKTGSEPPRKK